MTGVVTDSEGEAPIIVSLSGKIGKRATTPITVSWGSVKKADYRENSSRILNENHIYKDAEKKNNKSI